MKKFTKLLLLATIFVSSANALSFNSLYKGSEDSPFALSFGPDLIMGTGTAALFATSYFVEENAKIPVWDGNLFDINEVNSFDRYFMQPYNDKLHKVGTVTCGLELAAPIIVFGTETLFKNLPAKELVTIGTMYLESFMLSYGIKDLTKVAVLRARPYMYFDGYPQEKVDNGDYKKSFPSGHTTNAFMGAVFTTYVFGKYYPEGWQKWAVGISTLGLATATGCLRVASGNHFPTDVLAGVAIGSFCGFIVPFIHNKILEYTPMLLIGNKPVNIQPTINGISFICEL